MTRIVIADDHKLFRETLSDMLNSHPDFQVIALCRDSEEAIDIIKSEQPDIVLMDINILPFSGIEATKKIAAFSTARIIGLSMYAHPVYVKKMMQAGAVGYVTKNSSSEEIFTAVTEAAKGNKYICSEIKNIMSDQLMNEEDKKPHIGLLTTRELEVVNLIKEGFSSKEIASNIFVTLKTVEVHRHNILKKLQLKNASGLINFVHANAGFLS